jgi:hypothetical protein
MTLCNTLGHGIAATYVSMNLTASILKAVQSTVFLDCAEDGDSNILTGLVPMCQHTWRQLSLSAPV